MILFTDIEGPDQTEQMLSTYAQTNVFGEAHLILNDGSHLKEEHKTKSRPDTAGNHNNWLACVNCSVSIT